MVVYLHSHDNGAASAATYAKSSKKLGTSKNDRLV